MPKVASKTSASAAAAFSSLAERLLAKPSLVPLLVTAAAIAALHLTDPGPSLNDRYSAGFAVPHEGVAPLPDPFRGSAVAHAWTASGLLGSIR